VSASKEAVIPIPETIVNVSSPLAVAVTPSIVTFE